MSKLCTLLLFTLCVSLSTAKKDKPPCDVNQYDSGVNTCVDCPAFSTSPAGSTSIQACVCDINYYKLNNMCTLCPSNSISAAGSVAVSQCQCAQNYWHNLFTQTCVACGANQVSSFGSTTQSSCVCDSTSYLPISQNCTKCPSNSQLTAQGSTLPSSCACNSNYWLDVLTSTCKLCPTSSLSATGSQSKTSCKCPVNTYMNSNFTACVACPIFSNVSIPGATSVAQCLCRKNYYFSTTQCLLCPTGSSTNYSGTSRIQDCLCTGNKYLDLGTSTCKTCISPLTSGVGSIGVQVCGCASGQWLNNTTPSSPRCVNCPAGGITPNFNTGGYSSCTCAANNYLLSTGCTTCAPGMTSPHGSSWESTNCTCAAGYYKQDDSIGCLQCPTYAYTATKTGGARGLSDCICPTPHMVLNVTAAKCQLACPANMIPDHTGMHCVACAPNYYWNIAAVTNMPECKACPADSRSVNGSIGINSCICVAGTYWVPEVQVCRACGSGNFCPGDGSKKVCDKELPSARIACHTNLSTPSIYSMATEQCSCLTRG